MAKKEQWEIEHDKRVKAREEGMKAMSDDQIKAIDLAYTSLRGRRTAGTSPHRHC